MGWGDDMMWLGEASKIHQKNPDAVIHDGREGSILYQGVPWVIKSDDNTKKPKILYPRKPYNGNRWYIEGWAPGKVIYRNYDPVPAPYVISDIERARARKTLEENGLKDVPFVIINPDPKNTTLAKNKDWGYKRWCAFSELLCNDIPVVRMKPAGSVKDVSGFVEYSNPEVPGAINIVIDNIRDVIALIEQAQAVVTSEGGLHHFCAALNKRAFVFFGGAISPKTTGYKKRNQTYYVYEHPETPCGSQIDCLHCKQAMDTILPEVVYNDVMNFINGNDGKIYGCE